MRYSKRAAAKQPDRKIKIGASYDRVSTDGQKEDANGNVIQDGSPEAQKQRCASHARYLSQKTSYEHKITYQFSDTKSGKDTNRDAYRELWKLISERKIEFVIAAELSRLSRNVADFLDLVSHCEKSEVDLIIIGMDLDTSTPFGKMMVIVLVALAQFEREITAVRVRENALSRLINDGKINGVAAILGLDRDPNRAGHFLVNEDELLKVEKILKLFVAFSSKKKVLDEAKKLGITGKDGRELTAYMIDQTLENARWRYRGLWPANREMEGVEDSALPESKKFQLVELPHGPVITNEKLLNEVQQILDDPKRKLKRTGSQGYTYLLSRIMVFEDGTKFTGESAKGPQYRYYRNPGNELRIHCDQVDHCVIKILKAHLFDDKLFRALVVDTIKRRDEELPKIDRALKSCRKELSDFEARIATARLRMMDSHALPKTIEVWASEFERNQGLKAQKEAEIARLKDLRVEILSKNNLTDLRKTAIELLKWFHKLPGPQQRSTIERLVKKITIHEKDKITIEMYGEPSTAERGVETLRKKVRLERGMAPQDGLEPPTQ